MSAIDNFVSDWFDLIKERDTFFSQIGSMIDGYIDLIEQKGKGVIDFVTYIFTKCIPEEFQGLILFLLMMSIIAAYIDYIG